MRFKFVQIEPTTHCNANCEYCDHRLIGSELHHMDFAYFRNLVAPLATLTRHIHLQGLGEPFLHPFIRKMLKLLKSKGFTTSLTTNGQSVDFICCRYLDEIVFSLDGLSDDTNSLRHSIATNVVKESIEKVASNFSNTAIYLTVVVGTHNFDSLPELFDYVRRTKITSVYLVPLVEFNKFRYNLKKKQYEIIMEMCVTYSDVIRAHAFRTDVYAHCKWLREMLYISVDGFVRCCCVRASSKHPNLGLLDPIHFEECLSIILQHPYSQRLLAGKYDSICRMCIKYGLPLLWYHDEGQIG